MAKTTCSSCGAFASDSDLASGRCRSCGNNLSDVAAIQPADATLPTPATDKFFSDFDPATTDDVKIRLSNHGETLAILALLVPLVGLGLLLASDVTTIGASLAFSCGVVFVTASLLAIDAYKLGSTDMTGARHTTAGVLFVGLLLLWIVFYPLAYFQRRHFGRPNMGLLALLVAACFIGVPIYRDLARFGTLDGVPTCESKEVMQMVDGLVRQNLPNERIDSITGHRQTHFDDFAKVRKGECKVKIAGELLTVTYKVKLLDHRLGTFQVEIDPILSQPPECNLPEVIATLEKLVDPTRQRALKNHRQVRFDDINQTRECQCDMRDDAIPILKYRVFWTNPQQGLFEVKIDGQ